MLRKPGGLDTHSARHDVGAGDDRRILVAQCVLTTSRLDGQQAIKAGPDDIKQPEILWSVSVLDFTGSYEEDQGSQLATSDGKRWLRMVVSSALQLNKRA